MEFLVELDADPPRVIAEIDRLVECYPGCELNVPEPFLASDDAGRGLRQVEVLHLPRAVIAPEATGHEAERVIGQRTHGRIVLFHDTCRTLGCGRPVNRYRARGPLLRRRELLEVSTRWLSIDPNLELDVVRHEEVDGTEPIRRRRFATDVAARWQLEHPCTRVVRRVEREVAAVEPEGSERAIKSRMISLVLPDLLLGLTVMTKDADAEPMPGTGLVAHFVENPGAVRRHEDRHF